MKKILFSLIIISMISCKKESNKKSCWQLYDGSGAAISTECNKTEAELKEWMKTHCPNCHYVKM